jgi:PAS domain S-box-containing protein
MKLPLRVLYLEDDIRDAELVQDTLAADGITCTVRRVETETDFLAALDEGGFEIILAEYTLPGFDGLSALNVAQQRSPDVPFIFVSGALREDLAIETLKSGATDYVVKSGLPRLVPSLKRALREARERTERSHAEEALRRCEAYLAEVRRLSRTGSFSWDVSSGEIHWSEETFRIFEYDPATAPTVERVLQCTHPDDRARVRQLIERAAQERQEFEFEHRLLMPNGSVKYVRVVARPSTEAESGHVEFVGAVTEITERQRAEVERQAHLRFLESLDRVNQAIQGTNDLEQMMRAVLEVVLSIFGCDRAWLVYPCELEAPAWRAVMEQTRPEFPGAFALGLELPVDPEVAEVFRRARASAGATHFGPGYELAVPAQLAERFSIQSIIALAVYPKWDKPYLFGLHQCASPRTWTTQEERLFEEIGRRLADALSSLLMFRTLRQSEAKLEEAQRLTHVGYWERDLETKLLTWSDETYRIFGLRPEDPIRTLEQILERVHPEDRPIMREAVAEAIQGGPRYDVEYRVIRPTGEVRTVHSQGEVTKDPSGRPYRMFGTLQDITERKRAEQRLLAQHRVTQILAEAATLEEATPQLLQALCECLAWDLGALWHADRQAGVLRCVAFWRRVSVEAPQFETASRAMTFGPGCGLPGSVWLNREPAYFSDFGRDANFPRTPMATAEGLRAACAFPILLGGEVLGVIEFFSREIRPPDADLLNMMATIDSQLGQFIERKRAEEALQQAQAELSHLTRLTTLGELTTSIAHEINQPLAAVVTNANASLRWLAGDSPNLDETREAIRRIIRDGKRAGEIIGRIRALARKAPPQPGWLDLNQTIGEITSMLRGELHRHRVSLQTQLANNLPALWGDRIQLQQVLLNLLMNGIEALSGVSEGPRELMVSSQKGTEISGGSSEGTLETPASADTPGPHVLVTVRDTGPGLDPQGLERLFEAFYTTKAQGLGMGLAISRSIIQAHGGRLWARANAPQGAVFTFALPIREVGRSS